MKKKTITLAATELIEYKGDFYTPEELAKELSLKGDVEVILNDEDETWFGQALGDKQ